MILFEDHRHLGRFSTLNPVLMNAVRESGGPPIPSSLTSSKGSGISGGAPRGGPL